MDSIGEIESFHGDDVREVVSFNMIGNLENKGGLILFNGQLVLVCSFIVTIFFGVLYVLSYWMTSRAYYRIVK